MTCSKCQMDKPQEAFRGQGRQCKACVKKWHADHYRKPEIKARHLRHGRDWRKANPAKNRQYDLRCQLKRLGMNEDAYHQLVTAQGGLCAICKSESPGRLRNWRLLVDHNHATNEVRGLLCHQCNAGIGMFKDNPELLRAAIAYLTKGDTKCQIVQEKTAAPPP